MTGNEAEILPARVWWYVRFLQIHRQPLTPRGEGDMSRLFDVIDTPGFIPVHPGEPSRKKMLRSSLQQQQAELRVGTVARERQLDLGLFFNFAHPRLLPDELALLAAFHMLPHSCLFTIEEAAAAVGDALFRMREQLPGASELDRVMLRYGLNPLALNKDSSMGVQMLVKVSGRGANGCYILDLQTSRKQA